MLSDTMEDREKHKKESVGEASATSTTDGHVKDGGGISTTLNSIDDSTEEPESHHQSWAHEPKQLSHESENLNDGIVQQVKGAEALDIIVDSTQVNHISEEEYTEEKGEDPVFDGTEALDVVANGSFSSHDPEVHVNAWPEKAVALKNFVREKSAAAVCTMLRRLSGKKDEGLPDGDDDTNDLTVDHDDSKVVGIDSMQNKVSPKAGLQSAWNPLNFIKVGFNMDAQSKSGNAEHAPFETLAREQIMKGRIIVYTRLGCQDCKNIRFLLQQKMIRYIEINIDIFPSRKRELEKSTGSFAVPKVYFNDCFIGDLNEVKALNESGQLDEKIKALFNEEPSLAAPLPPLPGEDDESGSGTVDELASIVRKMKESIVLKDRFYKMRMFSDCFLGSEAVDFLAEDQYFEREEAVEFGKNLVRLHFFRHVLNENTFEDGNHLYRFLEHDPVIMTQCRNIPRGTIEVKPKPIIEIASRLRLLSYAIFEAYVSEDGRHVDYRSIHSCEEFKRYLRTIEELQRVDLEPLSREEKLAFFINLYNMMAIHAILTWGYPLGALDRRTFFGEFKYVIGGCAYSLSAIHNGILRGNQRPPYNLTKPFGNRDARLKVALPYPEPLIHFALVCGTRSGPALKCYSPGNIDKELMEAARDFIRSGGVLVDSEAKVASVTKILRWYNIDFGKNEVEVLKHAANYLDLARSEELLWLLQNSQLKVTYQHYDWGLNF